MLQPIAIVASAIGVGLAGFAFLSEGTGVTGTFGAYLALAGAAAVLIALLILVSARLSNGLRRLLATLAVLGAGLTALAAWFLMQDALTVVMAVTCIATLFVAFRPRPLRRI